MCTQTSSNIDQVRLNTTPDARRTMIFSQPHLSINQLALLLVLIDIGMDRYLAVEALTCP